MNLELGPTAFTYFYINFYSNEVISEGYWHVSKFGLCDFSNA